MKRLLVLLFLMTVALAAGAQSFPSKPVKIVVSYPAGGPVDVMARALAAGLQPEWGGNPVLVENRPGANAIIGTDYVAKQPADGHTLLFANDPSLSANQYLYSKLPYNPEKDLVPVAMVASTTLILTVASSLPANNVRELIALAKSRPGELSYGSFGPGSVTHLDTEAFATATGIKLLHVPYKGTADVVQAQMANQITLAFGAIGPVMGLIKSGKLKPLGVASLQRQPLVPDVPTLNESGVPGFEARSWFGIAAPTGTPRSVIDKVAADVRKVAAQPEYRKKYILDQGLDVLDMGPDQFAEFLVKDRAKYAQRIKNADVRLD
jgi:tripartite-type tricarboxylate transporter receptor subunit TctC